MPRRAMRGQISNNADDILWFVLDTYWSDSVDSGTSIQTDKFMLHVSNQLACLVTHHDDGQVV